MLFRSIALLNQTGTDAPVATVLENTLGGDIYFEYAGIGYYNLTLPFSPDPTKLFYFIGSVGDDPAAPYFGFLRIYGGDFGNILTQDSSFTNLDSMLLNTSIEIRIYN